jgi:hypothetical protein
VVLSSNKEVVRLDISVNNSLFMHLLNSQNLFLNFSQYYTFNM